ncbi:MAG: hypothetical protein KKB24_00960 [Candidatus Altiarchaeota archaeon]|nr:hypothetical protein [Candidatus Altiarchaeota archaeon]MBU4406137.1 hypothetical protein [Candidatus Altiarchaeota archaeon]MBU4436904.1 hypothetical protein [Candidatus Altiarchaeota archaeon]
MVLASHYVLKDVLNLLEREKHGRLEEVCTIYRDRYTEDEELLEVFDSILKHISSGESDPETLMKRLTDLISVRRMEVSGDSKGYF